MSKEEPESDLQPIIQSSTLWSITLGPDANHDGLLPARELSIIVRSIDEWHCK